MWYFFMATVFLLQILNPLSLPEWPCRSGLCMEGSNRLQRGGTSQRDAHGREEQRRQRTDQTDCGGRSSAGGCRSGSSHKPPGFYGSKSQEREVMTEWVRVISDNMIKKIKTERIGDNLLCNIWLRAELQEAPRKSCGCFKVAEFKEEIQGCAQHQNHVDRLQVAVGEICSHLQENTETVKKNKINPFWIFRKKTIRYDQNIFTSQILFCWSKVSLGNFFLSTSMVRPTMYSLHIVMSCWA